MGGLVVNTSMWSTVIHQVNEGSAQVWVGTLFSYLEKPVKARVRLWTEDGATKLAERSIEQWDRPFKGYNKGFFKLVEFTGLASGTRYRVTWDRYSEAVKGIPGCETGWQEVGDGKFDTLPTSLPSEDDEAFTVGIGSCFYLHRDGGQVASAYRALYERGESQYQPDVTFLTGDQVYLDIGADSISGDAAETRERIALDYAKHWQALGSILKRGGTWMLPDDHEYWNGYSDIDPRNPFLWRIWSSSDVRNAWRTTARSAVRNVQGVQPVRMFTVGSELSFCLADFRSDRAKHVWADDADFARVLDWARSLECPGVLALCQPLIVRPNTLEANLMSYESKYVELLEALGSSGHDIVLLTGDVHFGRVAEVQLGPNGGRLIEVIASPMSNLSGMAVGRATAVAVKSPIKFPHRKGPRVPGWPHMPVTYHRQVSHKPGRGFTSAYPKDRTTEHFMTVGFRRLADGALQLKVKAWQARHRGVSNLPVSDQKFGRAFTARLS